MDKTNLKMTLSSKCYIEINSLREDVYIVDEKHSFKATYINNELRKLDRPMMVHGFKQQIKTAVMLVAKQKLDTNKTFNDLFTKEEESSSSSFFLDDAELLNYISEETFDPDRAFFVYESGNFMENLLFNYYGQPVNLAIEDRDTPILVERHSKDRVFTKINTLLKKHPYILELDIAKVPFYHSNFRGLLGVTPSYNSAFEGQLGVKYWKVKLPDEIHKLVWQKVTLLNNTSSSSSPHSDYYDVIRCRKIVDGLDIYGINSLLETLANL